MKSIVINICHGGFSLSREALELYCKKKGLILTVENKSESKNALWNLYYIDKPYAKWHVKQTENGLYDFDSYLIERDDPALVEVVNELKDKANGSFAKLTVVKIPDDVEWIIQEYDGLEYVAEKHRTWQ